MPRTDSSLTGVLIQETDSLGLITLGQFTGIGSALPTTASKFAVGCLMSCAGDSKTYFNAGTVASPSWNSVSDASVGEISLTTGSVLIGAAGVGSALDVKGSGKILVGNGTTATSVSVSGDATLSSAGALTIETGAVTGAKVAETSAAGSISVPKVAVVVYDFGNDGGAQGTIALTGAPTIPANCAVWVECYAVGLTLTSATDAATVTLTLPTDGDLVAATAISAAGNVWDSGIYPVGQTSGLLATQTPKFTSAARVPVLTVAGGENLTAGQIVFFLRYQGVGA